MIGIRADGNSVIATGHIMRCMAIGDRLRELGEEVLFFLAGGEMRELVESRGFQVRVLNTDWRDMEGELDIFLPLLELYHISHLLLDSYQATIPYLNRLHEKVKVTYIDDLQLSNTPVDNVICYSVYSEQDKENYRKNYNEHQKLYLGLKFIPLRREFEKGIYQNAEKENGLDEIKDILITTGGTDSYHMALGVVETLMQCHKKWNFHVVIGKFHSDKDRLKEMEHCMSRLHLYENVVDMTSLMNHCDVAVSAGGTTIFELCCVGVPTLAFMMADNQKGIEDLGRLGLLRYVGDVRFSREQVLENIERCLQEYEDNPAKLLDISRHQRSMIDARGAVRIANLILGNKENI